VRASDLTGEAKELYEQWRALGYSERQALDRAQRSGLVREPELYEGFREFFGLSREAASIAALGRDPEPSADPRERTVAAFRELGLSEGAAEIAADGRDGPSSRPVSETPGGSSSWLKPGDNARLVRLIESWAQDLQVRGQLCVERGETPELAALREAYSKVFLNAQNDLQRLWITTVVREWRPELLARSGSSTAATSSGSVSETTRQRSPHSFTFEARGC
jgi:hypothetical protein